MIENLPFIPTEEQLLLAKRLSEFVCSYDDAQIFVLKGYAGTGKTSMVSALTKTLSAFEQKSVLLAPTGRAAKVFSAYASTKATSVHRKIYRQLSADSMEFSLDRNLHTDTLFLVDEASMISTFSIDRSFGSGNLLDDLIKYVYSNRGNRLLLFGDDAQLPPVMQFDSLALNVEQLQSYGLDVSVFELKNVVRQAVESGILFYANNLRENIFDMPIGKPHFAQVFADVKRLSGTDLVDNLQRSYDFYGIENCMVITRSNKRASRYNQGIRNQVLMSEDELSSGDRLLITKNNYFWSEHYKELDFIANGDIARIGRVRKHYELYGCRFADVSLFLPDYDVDIEVKILLDSLYAETSTEVENLNRRLQHAVMEDYQHIGNKRERYKEMRKNEFLNALQVKFAYAVTCHKAQGGQWDTVFVDQGYMADEQYDMNYYRWLYTAFTRAKKELFLINFPSEFFEDNSN